MILKEFFNKVGRDCRAVTLMVVSALCADFEHRLDPASNQGTNLETASNTRHTNPALGMCWKTNGTLTVLVISGQVWLDKGCRWLNIFRELIYIAFLLPNRHFVPMAKTIKKKRTPSAAFMKPVQPDSKLALVVGAKPLPRTELTKKLWVYIRKNGLQDKKVRTQINADDALKAVFNGKKSVSMFEMTKLVSGHVK